MSSRMMELLKANVGLMLGVTFSFLILAGCSQSEPVTFASLLREMIDRDELTRFPDPKFTNKQFSSYDRATTQPGDPSWFANWDRSMFLYVDSARGRKEYVMYEAEGPGSVVRFWMTFAGEEAGEGILRIYFDHAKTPEIEGPALDVLSGGLVATSPLCTSVSPQTNYKWRGHNFYLPLPYADHCKITYESEHIVGEGGKSGEAVYYNINYRTYALGTPVITYSQKQSEQEDSLMQLVKQTLLYPEPTINEEILTSESFNGELSAGQTDSIKINGARAIRYLKFKVESESMEIALRQTVLEMYFDGNRTVWAPLGDLFGTGYMIKPFTTFYNSVSSDGTLESFWVMPFKQEAVIVLHNLSKETVSLKEASVHHAPYQWSEHSMHFGASWHQYTDLYTGELKDNEGGGNPFDITYTKLLGPGVYAGDVITLFNTAYAWWGEGDEKIWVDDDTFPSHIGTGTEDYYGYAWCRPEFFNHPFIAQPSGSGNFNPGYTVNIRQRALDKIPFEDSIRVDMEMWHWVSTNINFAPTAFFYLKPGGKCLLEQDMAGVSSKIALHRSDIIPPGIKSNKVEGENFIIDSLTNGRITFQYGKDWGLSGNKQLFWHQGKIGDQLEVRFFADKNGRYDTRLFYTKAPDYGSYHLSINGSKVPQKVNGFHPSEVVVDTLSLGIYELKKGENTVKISIVGESPQGDKAFVGIDCLTFSEI